VGADGDLVAPAVFKTVRGRMTSGWLGSIPRRSRQDNFSRAMLKAFPVQTAARMLLAIYLPLVLCLELLHNHGPESVSSASTICCCASASKDADANATLEKSSGVCLACQFALTHAFSGDSTPEIEFSHEFLYIPHTTEYRFSSPLCASQRAPPQVS